MRRMRQKTALLLCVLAISPAAGAPTRPDPGSDALPSAGGIDERMSMDAMSLDRDGADDAIRRSIVDRDDPALRHLHGTVLIGGEFGDVRQTCAGIAFSFAYDDARYAQRLGTVTVDERDDEFEVAFTSERIEVYVVPEPVSISLVAVGLIALSAVRRRRF